jgi:hypothetical protein
LAPFLPFLPAGAASESSPARKRSTDERAKTAERADWSGHVNNRSEDSEKQARLRRTGREDQRKVAYRRRRQRPRTLSSCSPRRPRPRRNPPCLMQLSRRDRTTAGKAQQHRTAWGAKKLRMRALAVGSTTIKLALTHSRNICNIRFIQPGRHDGNGTRQRRHTHTSLALRFRLERDVLVNVLCRGEGEGSG